MMRFTPALVLLLLPTVAMFAQQQTFAVNTTLSEVRMRLNTTHEVVNGGFHVQSGVIQFDPATSALAGSVAVAAGSGDTGNDSRDKKMRTDILKVTQFSTISFSPKSYSGVLATKGDSTIQAKGLFTLLGVGHEITVPMHIHMEGSAATAKAEFIVPYVQWGLKNPSFLFWKADNDVTVYLTLVGTVSQ